MCNCHLTFTFFGESTKSKSKSTVARVIFQAQGTIPYHLITWYKRVRALVRSWLSCDCLDLLKTSHIALHSISHSRWRSAVRGVRTRTPSSGFGWVVYFVPYFCLPSKYDLTPSLSLLRPFCGRSHGVKEIEGQQRSAFLMGRWRLAVMSATGGNWRSSFGKFLIA